MGLHIVYRTHRSKVVELKTNKYLVKMVPKESEYLKLAEQRAAEKKTHVSFPQLKYPSLRDEGVKGPIQWLKGKALDDGAEGLWRVHDGIYDFTDFLNKHPGGAEWLELSKGTDITEAFESHHINPVDKILEKYYLRDARTPRNSPFTFKDDGFYRSLKRAAREELKKVPKSATTYANLITDGLLLTLLVNSVIACRSKEYWIVIASYLIASFAFAWLIVAAHNYIHKRSNWRMYYFNFALWSYRDFRVSHALSHHLYPNTLMDLEISGFEPLVIWNPREKPLHSNFALLIELCVFPFIFIINFVKRFSQNLFREGFFTQHYRWHDGVGLLLPIWMWAVSGVSFYNAFVMWLWIVCTASLIFCNIGSNAAHHHPKIFKDGDEVSDETPDWGIHQLEAVMDRTDVNGSLFRVITSFGDHALHHLFPTLDHAQLPYLYPVFFEYCEKFRAKYRTTTQFDLFIGQLKSAAKTRPSLLTERFS